MLPRAATRTAKLWDLDANRLAEDLLGHRGWVSTAAFAPDERTVLTASQDGTARIWDAARGRPSEELNAGLTADQRDLRRRRRSLLTVAAAHVRLWDLDDRLGRGGRFRSPTSLVNDADISPDGSLILTASQDGVGAYLDRARLSPSARLAGASR